MSLYLGCSSCIHREGDSCKAFPDAIPQAIASGEIRHDQTLPGDGGISFWPTEEAAETILGLSLPQYLFDAARNQKRKESKSCGCKSRSVPIFPAKMGSKDCGTGAGGFQPGNTCGSEEGSTSEIQKLTRDAARAEVDRILANDFEIFSAKDAETIRSEIDGGLFDEISIDPKSSEDMESIIKSRNEKIESFAKRASDLVRKMSETDQEIASRIILKTFSKSRESLNIEGIGADLGSIEENFAFAAEVVIAKELSDFIYRERPSEKLVFSSGSETQKELDDIGAIGAYKSGSISIGSDLKADSKERSATIAHELAHSAHVAKTSQLDRSLERQEKTVAFSNGMRPYAWSSSYEYVAVFSEMISQGHKFDADAWSLYDKLDGPDIKENIRKARTK